MKKKYIKPQIEVMESELTVLLCASSNSFDPDMMP
jgi:hypothetical protein